MNRNPHDATDAEQADELSARRPAGFLEHETGLEPATPTLATWREDKRFKGPFWGLITCFLSNCQAGVSERTRIEAPDPTIGERSGCQKPKRALTRLFSDEHLGRLAAPRCRRTTPLAPLVLWWRALEGA